MANSSFFLLPSSFAIALIAAMQGEASRMNVMKDKAEEGVKSEVIPASPMVTLKVDTMDSLAAMPVSKATLACQNPNPRGLKIGAMSRPIMASMLASGDTLCKVKENEESR